MEFKRNLVSSLWFKNSFCANAIEIRVHWFTAKICFYVESLVDTENPLLFLVSYGSLFGISSFPFNFFRGGRGEILIPFNQKYPVNHWEDLNMRYSVLKATELHINTLLLVSALWIKFLRRKKKYSTENKFEKPYFWFFSIDPQIKNKKKNNINLWTSVI